jgi:hypothetical protein
MPIMAMIDAYLIFAVGETQPASVLAGVVIGLVPMAVGLASLQPATRQIARS